MKKKKPFIPITLEIKRLSSKGYGAGVGQKTETSPLSKVVVPTTVPGDTVIAEIGPRSKRAYQGKLLEVVNPSPMRRDGVCSHAPSCGGCSLHYMDYESQCAHKQSVLAELFEPAFEGKLLPILRAKEQWRYRNKMEYSFSQNKEGERFLGLMRAGSKGRVENLFECHLSPDWFSKALCAVRAWWEESSLLAYYGIRDEGSLRTLTLREGKNTEEKMVILTVSGRAEYALSKEQIQSFQRAIEQVEGLSSASVFVRVQQSIRGQPTQFYEMHLSGRDHIVERLRIQTPFFDRDYQFKISPTAFFQPNTDQAQRLYAKALEMVGDTPRNLVLDLYAGTATLGLIFSSIASKVISIEINPYAVFDGQANQELNGAENMRLYKGDVPLKLKELQAEGELSGGVDLVVVDPPRTGLLSDAADVIAGLNPKEILYISCAPAHQLRDSLAFQEKGYEVVSIQPVDQFPQTIHIETIALLQRKDL